MSRPLHFCVLWIVRWNRFHLIFPLISYATSRIKKRLETKKKCATYVCDLRGWFFGYMWFTLKIKSLDGQLYFNKALVAHSE